MKRIALIAAAAALAVPAVFAQSYGGSSTTPTGTMPAGAVTSSTGASVSSGTGAVVAPASASMSTAPMASPHLLPGASMVQRSTDTKTMGAAPGPVQTVTTTTYWANVPSGVDRRHDFQRWMSLK